MEGFAALWRGFDLARDNGIGQTECSRQLEGRGLTHGFPPMGDIARSAREAG